MQITTVKSTSKKSIVDMLVESGVSKQKAENLYKKYKSWDKLETLQEYIASKLSSKESMV